MKDKRREILKNLLYAPRMDDLNPVAWSDAFINSALQKLDELELTEEEIIDAFFDTEIGYSAKEIANIIFHAKRRKLGLLDERKEESI